ncbi:MAG: thiamine biosynthesis protein ThiS [Clostridia bacterium BRH_c25]|nr:MAG: thiamine biosynthesis protein ThiS [Clostridia bacterium BRH_c25]
MIHVNGKEFQWEEGMTVAGLLRRKTYTYHKIVVKINDVVIPNEQFETTAVHDGDDVKAIHLLAGG